MRDLWSPLYVAEKMGEGLGRGQILLRQMPWIAQICDKVCAMMFEPTREAGLARLNAFTADGASDYGRLRNFDIGPKQPSTVSQLSPWIRHRLVSEQEVLAQILNAHDPAHTVSFGKRFSGAGILKVG